MKIKYKICVCIFFIFCAFCFCRIALCQTQSYSSRAKYAADITWNTDKPATSHVEYTEDLSKGYTETTELDNNLVTQHKVTLTDLKPAALYHYRVISKDSSGEETISKNYTLKVHGPQDNTPMQISDVQAENIVAAGISSAGKEGKEDTVRKEAKVSKEEPIQKTLIEKGGLLLPGGKLQIEPSFSYAHVSANKIAIQGFAILPILVIGEISADKVKRDIFIETVSTRYGIFDNLQANLKVPYKYQFERISNTANTESTRSTRGIGDIETGLFYQFSYEDGAMPGLIGGISVKSDTGKSPYNRDIGIGTGHWAVKPSIVWVKSSDPAIFFGSLGYTWNIKRDIDNFGDVDPGNTFEYSLGTAFALNYQTALNFQLEQQVTTAMRINNTPVVASFTNAVSFKTGFTYSLSKNLSLDVVSGYGLSEDAPDFTLEIRLPYTF